METRTWPQTEGHIVGDLLQAHDKQMVAHAARELRMAELVDELPPGILEARDVVDEVARICLEQPGKKPETLSYEQWFYQLIRQELDRQRRLFAEERQQRIELAPRESASDDESDGYDAERPLGLITSELEPEESLPDHHI